MLSQETFEQGLGRLLMTWPHRADDAGDVALLKAAYYEAVCDLDDLAWITACRRAVRHCKYFPVPAELLAFVETPQPGRDAEADFDLIRAQVGAPRDGAGMRLLPERATDVETFTRRRLMRDDPAAFAALVQAEIKANAASMGIGRQARRVSNGERSGARYPRQSEAEAVLESIRGRQEGRS